MARFSLFLVVLIPFVSMADASCKESPYNECGCPRRGTFDNAYLEKDYPNIISKYPDFTFYAPTVTYPNCKAIISTCHQESSAMVALVNGTQDITDKLDFVELTNPYNLISVICTPMHEWYNPGSGSVQAKLDSYKLGCKKAK